MRWQPPQRSPEAQAFYQAVEEDFAKRPDAYSLDPDSVLARALGDTPVEALGPPDWIEGFSIFLTSAEHDAGLNAFGRKVAADTAVGRLRARLALRRYVAEHPEAADPVIKKPIFIIGGWRTGTTFLQRLLADAPGMRALKPWELGAPWRAATADDAMREKLEGGAQAAHDRLHTLNSAMQAVHNSGADLAEECVLALGADMRNWGFLSTMRLSRYADWLTEQDFTPSYIAYRDILKILMQNDDRKLVLKAPAHTAELDALTTAFPDATIVWLHRDVVETVASGASLFSVFRSTYSDRVDPADVGTFQLNQTALWFDRAMDHRDRAKGKGGPHFIDIAYSDLIKDPMKIARRIHDETGVKWTRSTRQALSNTLSDNQQHKHGKHSYSPGEFDLDPMAVEDRFARYRKRFGV